MSRKRGHDGDLLIRRPQLFMGLLNKIQSNLQESNSKRRRKWARPFPADAELGRECPQTTRKCAVLQPVNKFGVRLVEPYCLYPYQAESVEWIIARETGVETNPNFSPTVRGCLFAMVMGLGKTIVISTVIAQSLPFQRQERSCSLYICPKTLLGTVLFEFNKFFGDQIRAKVYHRDFLKGGYDTFDEKNIRECDVLITSYETILARYNSAEAHRACGEVFMNFEWFRIVLDESHWIRSKKTKLFKACLTMRSKRRICMTGTPIHNSLSDLFHQLQFSGLVIPRGLKCNKFTLRSLNLMQMVKFVEFKDVLDVQLPPMSVTIEYFELSPTERKLHDMFMSRARRAFRQSRGGQGVRGYTGMFRVMQVCSAPYLVTADAKVDRANTEDAKIAKHEEEHIGEHSEPELDDSSLPPVDIDMPAVQLFLNNRDGPAGIGSTMMQSAYYFYC
jgi:SNF2 family DNA or RNA helicase